MRVCRCSVSLSHVQCFLPQIFGLSKLCLVCVCVLFVLLVPPPKPFVFLCETYLSFFSSFLFFCILLFTINIHCIKKKMAYGLIHLVVLLKG
uniref:Uncharacterized protein n=1 Tax=Bos indicus x Bos taurus TaxID=30522 RepID=A0A4W2IT04_BOBOX